MKLYEIQTEIRDICEWKVNPETGEIEIDDANRLDELDMSFDAKVLSIAAVVKNLTSDKTELLDKQAQLKKEADELKRKADAVDRNIDWLKKYAASQMLKLGKKTIKDALHRVTVRRNQPRVEILDEEAINREYIKVETKESVDKKKIAADWKETQVSPIGTQVHENYGLLVK